MLMFYLEIVRKPCGIQFLVESNVLGCSLDGQTVGALVDGRNAEQQMKAHISNADVRRLPVSCDWPYPPAHTVMEELSSTPVSSAQPCEAKTNSKRLICESYR
jgi:hypothetical protein